MAGLPSGSPFFATFVENGIAVKERGLIIDDLKEFFQIQELVGPKEYARDGELCWRYLRTELLETLLFVRRDILKVPMTVNTWNSGGRFDERGFRSNVSDIVKEKTKAGKLYISAHMLGCAVDFDAKGMTAEEARREIAKWEYLLPYPIRLERDVNWVHLDTFDCGTDKIVYFNG